MSDQHDFDPVDDCPNCGGEGIIFMCLDEIGCECPEEGCEMCDWCQKPMEAV